MKKISALLLATAMVLSCTACGENGNTQSKQQPAPAQTDDTAEPDTASGQETPAEDVLLKVWVAPALVSEDEQKMKQEEWYVSRVAKKFEEENPGVKVEFTVVPDQSAAHQTFKAAASTDSGPDIANLWSGQSIFAMEDVILDIKDYVPAEDKEQIQGWETVTVGFEEGGAVLGYPVSGNEICGLLYNRTILAEAGLDFDNDPPRTTDEFVEAMGKIKDAGYLPIAAGDDGWNGSYFFGFASLWAQQEGNARVASDSTGETKFAEDEAFKESYRFANELYSKGYLNEDYMTSPDYNELFLNEEAAMLITGNYMVATASEALGIENLGFCGFPDVSEDAVNKNTCIGGPGQCMVVSRQCKNPEMAVKFLSFLNNKENHIDLLAGLSKLPLRTDVSLSEVGMADDLVYQQIVKLSENYTYWADNSMVPEVNAEMQKLGGLAITGKMSVDEMAEKLDQKAAELAQ